MQFYTNEFILARTQSRCQSTRPPECIPKSVYKSIHLVQQPSHTRPLQFLATIHYLLSTAFGRSGRFGPPLCGGTPPATPPCSYAAVRARFQPPCQSKPGPATVPMPPCVRAVSRSRVRPAHTAPAVPGNWRLTTGNWPLSTGHYPLATIHYPLPFEFRQFQPPLARIPRPTERCPWKQFARYMGDPWPRPESVSLTSPIHAESFPRSRTVQARTAYSAMCMAHSEDLPGSGTRAMTTRLHRVKTFAFRFRYAILAREFVKFHTNGISRDA